MVGIYIGFHNRKYNCNNIKECKWDFCRYSHLIGSDGIRKILEFEMIDLPFKHIGFGDDEHQKYEERVKKAKKEKNLKGADIVDMLLKELKNNNFKTIKEKNYQGVNDNPFDLVAGDEETLDLYGFEIKGDTDNFSRLKTQLQAYLFCFNEVYLVLHKKKIPEWLPEYVGVIRVFGNGIRFIQFE